MRIDRSSAAFLVLVGALFHPAAAHARATHGEIRPLDAGAQLDGSELYPVDIGHRWAYRAGGTNRLYRHVIEPAGRAVAAAKKRVADGVELGVYEVALDGTIKEVQREGLEQSADGVRLVATTKGNGTEPSAVDPAVLVMPAKVTTKAWTQGSPFTLVGVTDVQTGAGSWQGCLVVDVARGSAPSPGPYPSRRFYCPRVGLALVLLSDVEGKWHTALELEGVATRPAQP
jgi:hypothetical protein